MPEQSHDGAEGQEGEGSSLAFLVGQDAEGRWLAVDTRHLGGGLFRSREAAVHFADLETGHRPGAIAFATQPIALRF